MDWQPIETAPKDRKILLLTREERMELGEWIEKEGDGPDSMGSDAGWITESGFTFPGRSFGNPKHQYCAFDPPTHWMERPKYPWETSN